jgi:hypothetical protein
MLELINKDVPLGSIKEYSVSVGTSEGTFPVENGTIGILDLLCRTSNVVSVGAVATEYGNGYTDVNMSRLSFLEYHTIADKQKSGRPTQFTTEVSGQELNIKVWPINNTTPRHFIYYALVQPDVVTRSTQDLDIMNRFVPAIIEGLAYRLGTGRKGVSTERLGLLKMEYKEKLQEAFDADKERVSAFFVPVIR